MLRAQGLVGTQARRGGVPAMLRRLGAVQLDTISVLARSHELVAYARLGPVGRQRVERAYWPSGQPAAFEYWSHAACVLPAEEWPYYAFRRRALRDQAPVWRAAHPDACAKVLARIRAEGPLTATDLGGARKGGPWWDWSEAKTAVEMLLDAGQVICVRRVGWRRIYDLPERVLPGSLLDADPSDAECLTHLAGVTGRALGVATTADLADYQRVTNFMNGKNAAGLTADQAAARAGLVPVAISSRSGPPVAAWADPAALAAADITGAQPVDGAGDRSSTTQEGPPGSGRAGPAGRRGRHRVTLLSPFDSLVWDRKRTLRVFEFEHSLEAYVPAPKRVHGYYTMPLLAGGRLAGRVDPARSGSTLIARQLTLDTPKAAEPMARARAEAASWVGCDSVQLGRVIPAALEPRLRAALAATGAA